MPELIPTERTTSAPKKPMVESQADAKALLLLEQERTEEARLKADLEDDSKWHYYVRCYRCHENGQHHVGVYLTKNPRGGVITQHEWYSSYKNRNDPWPGDILCQECYKPDAEGECTGEEFQLKVSYEPSTKKKGSMFYVDPNYLWRFAKDGELAKKYGRHRAVRVAYRSGNEQFAAMPNEERKELVRG
jgi:hypothetical protein